jgi:tetratricopeptide (TPR) repeat protein
MMKFVFLMTLGSATVLAVPASAADTLPAEPNVETVFQRLYNFDFSASQEAGRAYTAKQSQDPLGHASLALSYVFSEMNRLQVFNKDMFKEEKISGDQAKQIGKQAKAAFEAELALTKSTGAEALKKNPKDTNAILALMIATGAERDFAALVEKRLKDSYFAAKASQEYALQLQAIDPNLEDAWFTRGFSEYMVGSVPIVIRWLMKMEQVSGDKKKGLEFMDKSARKGRYLKPFAQMMLASIYQKDKRYAQSRELLEAFAKEYPDNQDVRKELENLKKK